VFIQYVLFSQDKSASLDQALIGLGMLFLLAIWTIALRHKKAMISLYISFVFWAVIQSVYGLWVFLSETNLLLWMPKLYYLDRPTGFFVNANHFAAYLVLSIILCLSKILSEHTKKNNQRLFLRAFDQLYNPYNLILCLLLITLFASKSIGAMVSLGSVVTIIGLIWVARSEHRKSLIVSLIILFAIILVLISSLNYSIIESQIVDFSHTLNRRIELSKTGLTMLQSNWLVGVGGGAFYSQFSAFRTLEIGNAYYNYAHNDFLQFWIEYGLIGIFILLLFIVAVMRNNLRVLSQSDSGIHTTFAYASIFGTAAVAIHSLVDFPLHLPGFSVCYLILISTNSLIFTIKSNSNDVKN